MPARNLHVAQREFVVRGHERKVAYATVDSQDAVRRAHRNDDVHVAPVRGFGVDLKRSGLHNQVRFEVSGEGNLAVHRTRQLDRFPVGKLEAQRGYGATEPRNEGPFFAADRRDGNEPVIDMCIDYQYRQLVMTTLVNERE